MNSGLIFSCRMFLNWAEFHSPVSFVREKIHITPKCFEISWINVLLVHRLMNHTMMLMRGQFISFLPFLLRYTIKRAVSNQWHDSKTGDMI